MNIVHTCVYNGYTYGQRSLRQHPLCPRISWMRYNISHSWDWKRKIIQDVWDVLWIEAERKHIPDHLNKSKGNCDCWGKHTCVALQRKTRATTRRPAVSAISRKAGNENHQDRVKQSPSNIRCSQVSKLSRVRPSPAVERDRSQCRRVGMEGKRRPSDSRHDWFATGTRQSSTHTAMQLRIWMRYHALFCRKHNIECSPACGQCKGSGCTNTSILSQDSDEE